MVYDISQTSAKDRQQAQEPKSMRELVSAMIDASPVSFGPVDDLEMPAFYDSGQQTIFIKTGMTEEQLFVSMAKEVSAAVFDFKHNESRDASDFKSFCVAYMVSSRYGVDTRGFNFSRLPKEFDGMDVFWRAFFLIFVAMIPYNQRCIFMRFYRISMHYRKFKDAFAPLTRLKSLTLR